METIGLRSLSIANSDNKEIDQVLLDAADRIFPWTLGEFKLDFLGAIGKLVDCAEDDHSKPSANLSKLCVAIDVDAHRSRDEFESQLTVTLCFRKIGSHSAKWKPSKSSKRVHVDLAGFASIHISENQHYSWCRNNVNSWIRDALNSMIRNLDGVGRSVWYDETEHLHNFSSHIYDIPSYASGDGNIYEVVQILSLSKQAFIAQPII